MGLPRKYFKRIDSRFNKHKPFYSADPDSEDSDNPDVTIITVTYKDDYDDMDKYCDNVVEYFFPPTEKGRDDAFEFMNMLNDKKWGSNNKLSGHRTRAPAKKRAPAVKVNVRKMF